MLNKYTKVGVNISSSFSKSSTLQLFLIIKCYVNNNSNNNDK